MWIISMVVGWRLSGVHRGRQYTCGPNVRCTVRLLLAGAMGLGCLALFGCAKKESVKVVQGAVTCGGEKVPEGRVTFVPLDGDSGPNRATVILDGQYRIEPKGGVRLGKYRVCVDARKKTGRKVLGFNGFQQAMVDETVRVGPEAYAGDQSPCEVNITADFDGRFDIALPR